MATKLTQIIDEGIAEDVFEAKPQVHKAVVINPKTKKNDGSDDGEEVIRTPIVKPDTVTGTREVHIADRKYTLLRRDPYGFWYIQPEKGRTPDELKGSYTSVAEAEKALTIYINT